MFRVAGCCRWLGCFLCPFLGVCHVFSCGVCFFFIPVGEGLSLFPCQRVMHWSVNLWFWVSKINL